MEAHALSAEKVLAELGSSEAGLGADEAAARLAEHGPNELPKEKGPSAFFLFFKQFHNALIYILLVSALISLLTGHVFDAAAILIIVLINGTIGFAQERKAEQALARLREMTAPNVTVRRDGRTQRIAAGLVVPGDIVLVAQGDRIAADLRLTSVRGIRADESALTGESLPVDKSVEPVAAGSGLGDRRSVLHAGTLVVAGEGAGVVFATGLHTAFGAIAGSLAAIERERTPLERRIARLGANLAGLAVMSALLIVLIGAVRGLGWLELFLTAVAAAVAAIPEGLPAVLAVTLAIGVQRMARRNAITRHLPAVETLGVVDVICTDKTGTLTENKMTVREIFTLDHQVQVTGEGWSPEGAFLVDEQTVSPSDRPVLLHLLRTATLCNRASLEQGAGRWTALGDPTEAALVVLGAKAGFDRADLLRTERTLDEIPFSSERKYRAILHEYVGPNGQPRREIMIIGALEVILEASSMALEERSPEMLGERQAAMIHQANERMAGKAMRILAVAVRQVDASVKSLRDEDLRGLTFLGLVGMIDPPRKGVAEAIRRCRSAGIRIIMNTGDHKATAVAIAREIGILGKGNGDGVYTDADVSVMDDAELTAKLATAAVFARVSPETKLRIVRLLRQKGHVVAMTGDGINDAPALKLADIGVAMGITGTDVTKEVADMVLADDNFISIVNAVEEGRIIFRNVKQTTAYLVMTNAGEIAVMIGALLLGLPLPLLPAQILWLNLVTDGGNDIALATEGRHGDELASPPRRKHERILSRSLFVLTFLAAALMAGGTLLLFSRALEADGLGRARSVAFLSMAFFQLWNVFSMRSPKDSVFSLGWTTNRWVLVSVSGAVALIAMIMYLPAFRPFFQLEPLGWSDWALTALVAASIFVAVEAYKSLARRGTIPESWH